MTIIIHTPLQLYRAPGWATDDLAECYDAYRQFFTVNQCLQIKCMCGYKGIFLIVVAT